MIKLLTIKKCPKMIIRIWNAILIIIADNDNIFVIKKCPKMIIRIT